MAKTRLLTASLAGSVDWAKRCPRSWRRRAMDELTAQLSRDYSGMEDKVALKRGRDFEEAVYAQASKADKRGSFGSGHFEWFVSECAGGEFQRKAKTYLTVDGARYCLFVKTDAWFPDVVKDIKTTASWKGPSHYTDSFQHVLYLYVTGQSFFRYLVAVFKDATSNEIVAHERVDVEMTNRFEREERVVAKVREVAGFLREQDLLDLWLTKFSMY